MSAKKFDLTLFCNSFRLYSCSVADCEGTVASHKAQRISRQLIRNLQYVLSPDNSRAQFMQPILDQVRARHDPDI